MPAQSIQRAIIYSPNSGNILDVPGHRLGPSELPEVEEERVGTAAGTTRARQRTHRLSLQLRGEEEIQLARLMEKGCPVRALGLGEAGTRQIVFNAPAQLSRTAAPAGPLGDGLQEVTLETRLFEPDITASPDLLAGVSLRGTAAERTELIAEREGFATQPQFATDLTHGAGREVLCVQFFAAGVVTHLLGSAVISDSQNLNETQGLAHESTAPDASLLYVLNRQSDGSYTIEKYDQTNAHASGTDIPAPPSGGDYQYAAYLPRTGQLYTVDTGSDEVIQLDGTSGYSIAQSFAPPTPGEITGLAIDPDAERLFIATDSSVLEELDLGGPASQTPTPIRTPESPDVVFGVDTLYEGFGALGAPMESMTWTQEDLLRVDAGPGIEYALHGLALRGEEPQARSWRVPGNTAVPVGSVQVQSARLRMLFPAGGVRVSPKPNPLANNASDLTLRALGYDGAVLSSKTYTDQPQAPFLLPEATWILEIDTSAVQASSLALEVVDPGRALGARPGGVAQSCDQRIPLPAWA